MKSSKKKQRQAKGLDAMVEASLRLGLYDDELASLNRGVELGYDEPRRRVLSRGRALMSTNTVTTTPITSWLKTPSQGLSKKTLVIERLSAVSTV
jgi:hypothetical protein